MIIIIIIIIIINIIMIVLKCNAQGPLSLLI